MNKETRMARNPWARAAIETIELRRLLSASLGSFGILSVSGTSRSDRIYVYCDPHDVTQLDVKINGVVTTYSVADVKQIYVNLWAGDDYFQTIEGSSRLNVLLYAHGSGGRDTMIGAGEDDAMNGGEGDDQLFGN